MIDNNVIEFPLYQTLRDIREPTRQVYSRFEIASKLDSTNTFRHLLEHGLIVEVGDNLFVINVPEKL